MTEITHEALEAAFVRLEGWPAALRESDLRVGALPSDIETIMEAYRTGQLILAQPSGDEVEACRYPVHGSVTHVRNVECCDFCGHPADTIPTAAITALDAHRGKQ